MRTTLTIEDSILHRLKEEAHQKGLPLKQVINTRLELGLRYDNDIRHPRKYKAKTFSLGPIRLSNPEKLLQASTELEDEEIIRKMELGK